MYTYIYRERERDRESEIARARERERERESESERERFSQVSALNLSQVSALVQVLYSHYSADFRFELYMCD